MKIYNIPFSPPDITEAEINEVVDTLKSGWITTGPKTKLFEEKIAEYCGVSKAVCLNSATAALELTLHLLGIGKGDEVITSAYTYTASASVICHTGATPVLVDTAENSFEMDYNKLKSAITSKTKAIIPVDIAGVMCDYDRINRIALELSECFTPNSEVARSIGHIAVIADAAHSFGATSYGKRSGQAADFTCFSFHAVKNLTTGEGGAVAFFDTNGKSVDDIYKKYMLLSLHGQSKDALAKTQLGAWEYDIISPAFKCNMTDISASIGLAQLRRYDAMLKRRHDIIDMYDNAFDGHGLTPIKHSSTAHMSSGHLYIARIDGKDINFRNGMIKKLAELGVSTNVHYKPLPLLTAYKRLGFNIKDYPNAYEMYQNEITLPLYSTLSNDEVGYISEQCISILR